MRKLARLETIIELNPIEGADLIEVATVQGWQVVVKKGEFSVGDSAVYFEIDSWVPHSLAPFLTKGDQPKSFNDIPGNRLRTVKLRGQVSQGLLLPIAAVEEKGFNLSTYAIGDDVSEYLNVTLYEPPVKPQLAGISKGNFPSFITKTDEERVQNLKYQDYLEARYYTTEKLDGSSMTVFFNNGEFGVCSRNMNLVETETNTFWQVANKFKLREKLTAYGVNIAIQGELIGPGIQGNPYKLSTHTFRPFTVFNIDKFVKE
jgi:RNA ligase (TIGR02306 family)